MRWFFMVFMSLMLFSCGGAEKKGDKFQEIRDRANESHQTLEREETTKPIEAQ